MKTRALRKRLPMAAALCLAAILSASAIPAAKNMALVVSTSIKLTDVSLAELAKLCKGTQKSWPDGKAFTLVIRDPESPDMRTAVLKLFGATSGEAKAAIAKINEIRPAVKIVSSDEELIHTVEATPGAVGIIDVY